MVAAGRRLRNSHSHQQWDHLKACCLSRPSLGVWEQKEKRERVNQACPFRCVVCTATLEGCVQADDVTSERRLSLKGPLHYSSTATAASSKVHHKLLFIWTSQTLDHNFTSRLQKEVIVWECSTSSLLTFKKLFNKEKKIRASCQMRGIECRASDCVISLYLGDKGKTSHQKSDTQELFWGARSYTRREGDQDQTCSFQIVCDPFKPFPPS